MRILLIHQYYLEKDDGGGSRFNQMTKIWSNSGHKITVIAGMVHYNSGKKPNRYKGRITYKDLNFYKNVDVIRCYVSKNYNLNFLGRLFGYFSFLFSSIYAGIFKIKGNYDLILVTSPPLFLGISAYILSKIYKIPYVFEIRDLWPESAIDTGFLKNRFAIKFAYLLEDFIYSKSKLITVLTPAFKNILINKKKINKEKIIFIPNAADFSLIEKLKKKSNFNKSNFKKKLGLANKFVITYVGAHGVANHLIQLIDVAESLQNSNIVFQLIGSGMEKENLIKITKEKKLKNIIFREPVSKLNIFKYILSSDVGLSVLKKTDTFKTIYSNKTFDYMACKIPVLLLIDGVSKELVETAKCGVYAEPENTIDITKKVINISSLSKKKLKLMGINGYNYALNNFNRNNLSIKYLKYLNKII